MTKGTKPPGRASRVVFRLTSGRDRAVVDTPDGVRSWIKGRRGPVKVEVLQRRTRSRSA